MTGRELHWKSGDRELDVRIEETGDHGVLQIGGRTVAFVLHDRDSNGGWLEIDGRNRRFYVHRSRDDVSVWIDGHTYRLTKVQKGQTVEHSSATGPGEIRALMPGKILRIDVAVGAEVSERQTVVTMESMKMESALTAPRAGKITAVKCTVGQVVDMGDLLVIIE